MDKFARINKTAQKEQNAIGRQPKYRVVYRGVLADIRAGKIKPGAKVPSVRQLAERYGFQRGVALNALTRLAGDGYLCATAKSGFYVNPSFDAQRTNVVGFFLNEANPMEYAELTGVVYNALLAQGFQPVFGTNYRNVRTLAQFLSSAPMDGLLLAGRVDESVLTQLHCVNVPYVVLGNHDIAGKHPQARYSEEKLCQVAFAKALAAFRGKTAAMFRDGNAPLHHGIVRAFAENGIALPPKNILTSATEKLPDVDVLCVCPECIAAYRKICRATPRSKGMTVFCPAFPFQPGDRDLFDISVVLPVCDVQCAVDGVKMLLNHEKFKKGT